MQNKLWREEKLLNFLCQSSVWVEKARRRRTKNVYYSSPRHLSAFHKEENMKAHHMHHSRAWRVWWKRERKIPLHNVLAYLRLLRMDFLIGKERIFNHALLRGIIPRGVSLSPRWIDVAFAACSFNFYFAVSLKAIWQHNSTERTTSEIADYLLQNQASWSLERFHFDFLF